MTVLGRSKFWKADYCVSGLGEIPRRQVECDWGLPLHHPHLQHQHLRRPLCSLPLLFRHQGALAAIWSCSQVLFCQGSHFPLLLAGSCFEYHGGLYLIFGKTECRPKLNFRRAEWFSRFTAMMDPTSPLREQYRLAIRTFSSASRCFLLLWLWSEFVAWD